MNPILVVCHVNPSPSFSCVSFILVSSIVFGGKI